MKASTEETELQDCSPNIHKTPTNKHRYVQKHEVKSAFTLLNFLHFIRFKLNLPAWLQERYHWELGPY